MRGGRRWRFPGAAPLERDQVSSCSGIESVFIGPCRDLREGLARGSASGETSRGCGAHPEGPGQAGWGLLTRGVRRVTPAEALTKLNCAPQRLFSIFIVGKSHFKDFCYLEAKLFFLSVECGFFTMTS